MELTHDIMTNNTLDTPKKSWTQPAYEIISKEIVQGATFPGTNEATGVPTKDS